MKSIYCNFGEEVLGSDERAKIMCCHHGILRRGPSRAHDGAVTDSASLTTLIELLIDKFNTLLFAKREVSQYTYEPARERECAVMFEDMILITNTMYYRVRQLQALGDLIVFLLRTTWQCPLGLIKQGESMIIKNICLHHHQQEGLEPHHSLLALLH